MVFWQPEWERNGTGATPTIAQSFKRGRALTIAVITKPFAFEGTRRMVAARRRNRKFKKIKWIRNYYSKSKESRRC